nr:hypothetical protein [Nocardioides sp.]
MLDFTTLRHVPFLRVWTTKRWFTAADAGPIFTRSLPALSTALIAMVNEFAEGSDAGTMGARAVGWVGELGAGGRAGAGVGAARCAHTPGLPALVMAAGSIRVPAAVVVLGRGASCRDVLRAAGVEHGSVGWSVADVAPGSGGFGSFEGDLVDAGDGLAAGAADVVEVGDVDGCAAGEAVDRSVLVGDEGPVEGVLPQGRESRGTERSGRLRAAEVVPARDVDGRAICDPVDVIVEGDELAFRDASTTSDVLEVDEPVGPGVSSSVRLPMEGATPVVFRDDDGTVGVDSLDIRHMAG